MPLPKAPKKLGDMLPKTAFAKKGAATRKTSTKKSQREPALQDNPSVESRNISLSKAAMAPTKGKTKKTDFTAKSAILGPAAKPKPRRLRPIDKKPRLFVLDTNVLLHDPMSLFRFEEHDVFLPMMTLEELDAHKTGTSDLARSARQVSRWINQLIESTSESIESGVALDGLGNTEAKGKLFLQTKTLESPLPEGLAPGKADNRILAVVKALETATLEKTVVLVSKDINMRIKARALGVAAEDYFNDRTLEDTDMLYSGRALLEKNFWETHADALESWQEAGVTFYRIAGPVVSELSVNEFVHTEDKGFTARVRSVDQDKATLTTITDYTQQKNAVWGICARNLEQGFALNLLMDPDIDFVTLLGQAGTGKTLLTLAAALSQTLDERRYNEIIFTRATVSVGDDIGYLPGTEEEKMQPWMGALEDNLEVLNKSENSAGQWGRNAANDLIRSRIRIKSMSFMRGRTFLNKFVIIDEAQNLTPKQMKTLITRAGPGTKIVCLGNIAQIDTPYLTEGSSGLTYVVDRFRGWTHAGHVTLARGERSRLADHASEIL